MKWHYGSKLDLYACIGGKDYTKADFLAVLDEIRTQTFSSTTIKGSFKNARIIPLNAKEILPRLRSQEDTQKAAEAAVAAPKDAFDLYCDRMEKLDTLYNTSTLDEDAFEPLPADAQQRNDERKEQLKVAAKEQLWLRCRTPTPPPLSLSACTTLLTVRTLRKQQDQLLQLLPTSAQAAAQVVFKGALAQAQESAQYKKALLQTKAAENARSARRLLSQRQVSKGGPIKLKDARKMIARRQETDKEELIAQ